MYLSEKAIDMLKLRKRCIAVGDFSELFRVQEIENYELNLLCRYDGKSVYKFIGGGEIFFFNDETYSILVGQTIGDVEVFEGWYVVTSFIGDDVVIDYIDGKLRYLLPVLLIRKDSKKLYLLGRGDVISSEIQINGSPMEGRFIIRPNVIYWKYSIDDRRYDLYSKINAHHNFSTEAVDRDSIKKRLRLRKKQYKKHAARVLFDTDLKMAGLKIYSTVEPQEYVGSSNNIVHVEIWSYGRKLKIYCGNEKIYVPARFTGWIYGKVSIPYSVYEALKFNPYKVGTTVEQIRYFKWAAKKLREAYEERMKKLKSEKK